MADNKIKIVGICGSHRHEQNTWYALKSCLEQIKTLGILVETELIDINRMRIEDCKGCHACFTRAGNGSFCPVIHDDMEQIYPKLLEADGIIAASPVHWWSCTSKLRRFIERTNAFCGSGNTEYAGALYNKVGGVIAIAYDVHGGTEVAASHMATWMLSQNMIVVGTQSAHIGGTAASNLGVPTAGPDSIKFDCHGMRSVYEVGKRVAETAYIMKLGRANLPEITPPTELLREIGAGKVIDWEKFYQHESSFPKEHYGVEGRWATSETAFETFLSEMKTRKKSAGNTWGVIADEDAFRKAWLEKRQLALLSDEEIYALCPDYYNEFLKEAPPEET